MFDNIGEKIKSLTKIIAIVGIVSSVLMGFVIMVIFANHDELSTIGAIIGLIIMVVGSVLSWVSAFVMYGYGELISKTTEIESMLRNSKKFTYAANADVKKTSVIVEEELPQDGIVLQCAKEECWICPECCRENDNKKSICKCGYERN